MPVGAPLKAALETLITQRKDAVTLLTTEQGRAWTESGFRASWRKACVKAGVQDVTFHDLRGTAVTRLALARCSEAEIATKLKKKSCLKTRETMMGDHRFELWTR